MSVWVCVPSARPKAEVEKWIQVWRNAGYRVALFRDLAGELEDQPEADMVQFGVYPGYSVATNRLVADVLKRDQSCSWVVGGGDDVLPDPDHAAEEIALECSEYFAGRGPAERVDASTVSMSIEQFESSRTFGVMQCTGDRYAGGCIDRIAGSAWMGRSFCERMNKGQGPFHPGFSHMFSDECLRECAVKLGVYWERPDLIHFHNHFMRESAAIDSNAVARPIPTHLVEANSRAHWDKSKELFERLKADDFAECMPL